MTVPTVHNWFSAGAQIKDLCEVSEAFIRGDQPEKTEHLTLDDITKLHERAMAVLDFCVRVMPRKHSFEITEIETYVSARQFARNLTHQLLHHPDFDRSSEFGRQLHRWVTEEERHLPNVPQLV
ncbi:TPA: hypothetical protein DCF80_02070 [Candidatus Saccharibacteria bacterium]|nr:hypothetical protein [Candidatus Saccharibacteria bacterium]